MTLSRYAITYSPKLGGYAVIYRDSGELVSRHANKTGARAAFKRYKEADERRDKANAEFVARINGMTAEEVADKLK